MYTSLEQLCWDKGGYIWVVSLRKKVHPDKKVIVQKEEYFSERWSGMGGTNGIPEAQDNGEKSGTVSDTWYEVSISGWDD